MSKGAKGYLDQLLIYITIIEDCRKKKRNLLITWLDYQRAFESMPHSCIVRALELMGVHPNIVNARKNIMENWSTVIQLRGKTNRIITSEIKIRQKIYEEDRFSLFLFCVGFKPLSHIETGHKQSIHLPHMDDLKLFRSSDGKLQKQFVLMREFRDEMGMKFCLYKSAKVTFKKGGYIHGENMVRWNGKDVRTGI